MRNSETLQYGSSPDQVGDLYLPDIQPAPVVCLLHGGFWRQPYGRDQMAAIAEDLQSRGYAVWNLEYRRVGAPGVEWGAVLDDVLAGIDYLAQFPRQLDLDGVIVCGHSAGGHLALWAAAQRSASSQSVVKVRAVVGQAPIADLVAAHSLGLGGGAVHELLGGTPETVPDRFAIASPRALLPLGVPQFIIHGEQDSVVPAALAHSYVLAACGAGDAVELEVVPDHGHMEFLDPTSVVHRLLCEWLAAAFDA